MITFPTAHYLTQSDEWEDFKVVLTMRDPLEAVISTFYISGINENNCHYIRKKKTFNLTVGEVANCTPMVGTNPNMFGNFQCRFLSGDIFSPADNDKLELAKKVVEKSLIANINTLEEVEEALSKSMKLPRNIFRTSEQMIRSGSHHNIDGDADCPAGLVTVGKYCMTQQLYDGLREAN